MNDGATTGVNFGGLALCSALCVALCGNALAMLALSVLPAHCGDDWRCLYGHRGQAWRICPWRAGVPKVRSPSLGWGVRLKGRIFS